MTFPVNLVPGAGCSTAADGLTGSAPLLLLMIDVDVEVDGEEVPMEAADSRGLRSSCGDSMDNAVVLVLVVVTRVGIDLDLSLS